MNVARAYSESTPKTGDKPSVALVRQGTEERGVGGRVLGLFRSWTRSMGGPALEERLDHLKSNANEFGVDAFGLDTEFAKAAIAPVLWLYKHYFRVEAHGLENIPPGRVLIISNHSGQLPFDGAMIGAAMLSEMQQPRVVRAMVEKWVPTLPFISSFFARMGQVVGTPENCRRLLSQGEAILVFPEGAKGISKLYRDAYQLQDFGNGFLRLALETDTPIVPVAVIGAEEQAPALADLKGLARLLGMPAMPVTVQGLPLPLPVKYRLYFGEPMYFKGSADEEDAEIEKKVRQVKATIQAMLNEGLRERKHIFW
jgi:1-acyl-sn-glycerol-3-phosphate acyltransferase